MENLNKFNCLTFLGAARTLGVSLWRIRYAVDSGYLPPPSAVLKKRLLFSPEQIAMMKRFFDMEETHRRNRAANTKNGNQANPGQESAEKR